MTINKQTSFLPILTEILANGDTAVLPPLGMAAFLRTPNF